jgi:hypothetical protein
VLISSHSHVCTRVSHEFAATPMATSRARDTPHCKAIRQQILQYSQKMYHNTVVLLPGGPTMMKWQGPTTPLYFLSLDDCLLLFSTSYQLILLQWEYFSSNTIFTNDFNFNIITSMNITFCSNNINIFNHSYCFFSRYWFLFILTIFMAK